jgi:hypothetical protein
MKPHVPSALLLVLTLSGATTSQCGAMPHHTPFEGTINLPNADDLRITLKRKLDGRYWNGRRWGWGRFDALLSLHAPQLSRGQWRWTYDLPLAEQMGCADFAVQLWDISTTPRRLLSAFTMRPVWAFHQAWRSKSGLEFCYTAGANLIKSSSDTGNHMNEIVPLLKEAVANLTFISETDAPLEVVFWPGNATELDERLLAELAQVPVTEKIAVVEIDDFFADVTAEQEWHNAEEKAEVRRFQQLVELLKARLQGARAYRVGDTRITVYVVGKVPGGFAGVKTVVVES